MTQTTHQVKAQTPTTMQESLLFQARWIGMPNITNKNYVEFFERGKNLQVLGIAWVTKEVDSSLEGDQTRTPTLEEVKAHIGLLEIDVEKYSKKKWKNELLQMILDLSRDRIKMEQRLAQRQNYQAYK